MKLFGKGKAKADEDELIDSMVDDNEKALPKQENSKGNEQAKLEKLDAQLNALRRSCSRSRSVSRGTLRRSGA